MATSRLKRRLEAGETVWLGWLATCSPAHGAALARSGFGAVAIDAQHGVASTEAVPHAIAAIAAAGAAPLIRCNITDPGTAALALDFGAEGVIAPMINTAEDATALVRSVKYPPAGDRSWGPVFAGAVHGLSSADMLATANDWAMAIAMIETRQALENRAGIMATPGLDAIFVGPSDLSISLSGGRVVDPGATETLDACADIAAEAARHGLPAAIFAVTPELAARYHDMGYRLIVLGTDLTLVADGAKAWIAAAKGARP